MNKWGVCGWLANAFGCKSGGQSSIPRRERARDHFSALSNHEGPFFSSFKSIYVLSCLITACLAFVCTARIRIVVHIEDPLSVI